MLREPASIPCAVGDLYIQRIVDLWTNCIAGYMVVDQYGDWYDAATPYELYVALEQANQRDFTPLIIKVPSWMQDARNQSVFCDLAKHGESQVWLFDGENVYQNEQVMFGYHQGSLADLWKSNIQTLALLQETRREGIRFASGNVIDEPVSLLRDDE